MVDANSMANIAEFVIIVFMIIIFSINSLRI